MPKIYFYDTGLLCYLLSIQTPDQLDSHPLKGAVFENMAMCELLKKSFNEGEHPEIYFYRENSGLEVDAMTKTPDGRHLYEIKAGKVLRPDYLENMQYLKRTLPDVNKITVIFDGQSLPPLCVNIREL